MHSARLYWCAFRGLRARLLTTAVSLCLLSLTFGCGGVQAVSNAPFVNHTNLTSAQLAVYWAEAQQALATTVTYHESEPFPNAVNIGPSGTVVNAVPDIPCGALPANAIAMAQSNYAACEEGSPGPSGIILMGGTYVYSYTIVTNPIQIFYPTAYPDNMLYEMENALLALMGISTSGR